MTKLERKVKQLQKLTQYKGLSNKELEDVAQKSLERDKLYKVEWIGFSSPESRRANELLRSYIEKYHITKFSDREDLKTLIENEILKQRIQSILGENKCKTCRKSGIPQKHIIDSLNTLQNQILVLKEKLGIFDDKKQTDAFAYIQKLKKKLKKWEEENQASRTFPCQHCSKINMLVIKKDAWNVLKHPYFRDKILANKHLIKLFKEGTLTKKDVAKIFGTSPDYVGWLIERWYQNDK